MARERKKPEGSFIERAKNEIENEDTLLTNRAYELGRIRGRKEQQEIGDKELESYVAMTAKEVKQVMIEKACEWWYIKLTALYPNDLTGDVVDEFRKAMEE